MSHTPYTTQLHDRIVAQKVMLEIAYLSVLPGKRFPGGIVTSNLNPEDEALDAVDVLDAEGQRWAVVCRPNSGYSFERAEDL